MSDAKEQPALAQRRKHRRRFALHHGVTLQVLAAMEAGMGHDAFVGLVSELWSDIEKSVEHCLDVDAQKARERQQSKEVTEP